MQVGKMRENAFTHYQRKAAETARGAYDFDERHERAAVAAMGLAGESGELIDALKKWIGHGHELDLDYGEKELGDILWYIAEIGTILGINLASVAERNEEKLKERYPEGFSAERSRNRGANR